MNAGLERGYLLLADLSGYTAYLTQTEPEHGPMIAGDFIETVVGQLHGAFRLEKLEGDAAFLWAPMDRVNGGTLLDAVDAAYFGFQRRLQSVSQATACDCEACSRMPQLDLKFVIHLGDALRQRIAGREELAGRDVILAHRLLKGSSLERVGTRSYLLLTDAALIGLDVDAAALGMIPVVEQYEGLGSIHCHLLDLGARWQDEQQRPDRAQPAGRLVGRLERLLPVPPRAAWDLLTAPTRRTSWEGMTRVDEADGTGRGVGSLTTCVVGRLKTVEEVVDWRPFETFARRLDVPQVGRLTSVYRLSELGNGTHLEASWFALPGPAEDSTSGDDSFVATQTSALDRLVDVARGEIVELA